MFLFTSKSIWHTGLIDVIGQTTKLLGHCGCYSFICNVPQKNTGSREWPYKLPSFINCFFNQSVLFLGRKCILSTDVVIINHRNHWCWTCDRECHFHILFSTWNSCLISLQCYLYNLYMSSVMIINLFSFTTAVLVFWIKTVLTKPVIKSCLFNSEILIMFTEFENKTINVKDPLWWKSSF